MKSGQSHTVQAMISREGKFQHSEGKYRTAYLIFQEAMRATVSDFRDLEWDPYTDLVFTTESSIPTSGETRLEVYADNQWIPDSNPTIPDYLSPEARVRIVIGLTEPLYALRLPWILMVMAHEWGVHAHWYWSFVKWMRKASGQKEVAKKWRSRNSETYKGSHPLHGDLHHTLLAHDEATVYKALSKELKEYLPKELGKKFIHLTKEDVEKHAKFKRKEKKVEENSKLSALNMIDLDLDRDELESFLDDTN